MDGVEPESHNSRFNHADRSEPDCLEYLNCREQAESLSDRTPGVRIWSISAFRGYRRPFEHDRSRGSVTQLGCIPQDRCGVLNHLPDNISSWFDSMNEAHRLPSQEVH